VHWTYSQPELDSDLQQGDFLVPTDELREILSDVHPHFCADKYIGFVVTTQTCDLVRRGSKSPKAHYINIAAVRSLKDTAAPLFERIARPVAKGIFLESNRVTAKEFLHRLFNQNEQALGLFYLHPDADIGLGDHSVAFLRIVIALRAEHYSKLLTARRGGLKPAFQAKLGWLVGNLYSRAATPDWSEQEGGKNELDQLECLYLKEHLPGRGPIWVEDQLIWEGQANNVVFDGRNTPDLIEELEQYRPPPPIDKLVKEVADQAKAALTPHPRLNEQVSEAFQKAEDQLLMLYDEQIKSGAKEPDTQHQQDGLLVKEEIQNAIEQALDELKAVTVDLLSVNDTKITKLSNRLKNNGKIKKLIK